MKTTVALMILLLPFLGCGGSLTEPATTTTRDITSCNRPQWPVPCDIDIACGRPIEACLAAGCFINGTDLFFSPDGYWSGRGGETGRWTVSRDVMGRKLLVYGDIAAVVQDDGAPLACP